MTTDEEAFELNKSIWTQDDFEEMGWHDANIYGLTFESNKDSWTADLLLDIDYLFKWVHPTPPELTFTFWIAPCTIIFKETFDLKIDFTSDRGCLDTMEIADLNLKSKTEQEKNRFIYEWSIELQQGEISLKSYGFEQVVRQKPRHVSESVLSLESRGGISFGRKPFSDL